MKNIVPFIIAIVGVIAAVILITGVMGDGDGENSGPEKTGSDLGGSSSGMTADEIMEKVLSEIKVTEAQKIQSTVDYADNTALSLPNIETKYPLTVTGDGQVNIEIFATSEKAGKGNSGWINEIAEKFNKSGAKLSDGKSVSVSIRNIPSGASSDYISNNVYIPQGYSPSNSLFGELAVNQGAKLKTVSESLVKNSAGIAIDKGAEKSIEEKHGEVTFETIIDSVIDGELQMGYTYPYTSATGLNFLVNSLQYFDSSDILSDSSVEKFRELQKGIPFVCYTTDQMVSAMQSGSLQAGVVEYQSFTNSSALKTSYDFIPFGYEHENPLYSVGELSEEQQEAIEMFADYASESDSQKLAAEYGFNQDIDYSFNTTDIDGSQLSDAQALWKKEKNSGTPTIALFIADVSGSMMGDPISRLKTSLLEASKKINSENYIGLISYSDDITINLPIAEFDLEQRSYFAGAVENLVPVGNTATYDALIQGVKMVLDAKEQIPDANTMIFLLSDGQCNKGLEYSYAEQVVREYGIPIYTIGYNEDIDSLKNLSQVNEAVYINADTDDVVYELSALFNAQM